MWYCSTLFSLFWLFGLVWATGCSMTGEAVLPYQETEIRQAMDALGDTLGIEVDHAVTGVTLYERSGLTEVACRHLTDEFSLLRGLPGDRCVDVPDASAALSKPATSFRGRWSAGVVFSPRSADSTHVHLTAVSKFAYIPAGDYANLIPGLIDQQMQLQRGVRQPVYNTPKSVRKYLWWTALSPLAGIGYLQHKNPMLSRKTVEHFFWSIAAFEALGVGLIVAGAYTSDRKERWESIGIGITGLVIWRLVFMLGVADIYEYNALARSPYDVQDLYPRQ